MKHEPEYAQIRMGSERNFGLVFGLVFTLFGLWPIAHGQEPRIWALVVAAAFLISALVAPRLLAPLNKLWFKFGLLLGRFVAPVVMAMLFFAIFAPFGLTMRLFGKDLLRQKFDATAKTYWIERQEPAGTMKNQF